MGNLYACSGIALNVDNMCVKQTGGLEFKAHGTHLTPSFKAYSSLSPRSFLWNVAITALWILETHKPITV